MQVDTGGQSHETGQRLGPYRLEQLLGSGGMGEVYRAFDERLGRRVALKQIRGTRLHNPRSRRRFRREARAAAQLNHPAIVQIHDIVEGPDADWIVMELVEGRTLAESLRSGALEIPRAVEILGELVAGLEAAHHLGVVHRDLKSENMMLTGEGRLKILDFGLAKQVLVEGSDPDEQDSSLSLDGTLLGTARAMAPEQALGKPVDHRSDLFSLGTLAYEMVTGKSPFLAPTAVETAIRVCSHQQTPAHQHNREVPRLLSELIDRLLEKEPGRRPQSATEVATELAGIAADLAADSGTEPSPPTTERSALSLFDVAEGELSLGEMESVSSTVGGRGGEGFWLRYERRHLTVLCCDLVAAQSEDVLEPEDFYELARRFRHLAERVITRFGGQIAPSSDHRLLAYFGFPTPRRDAAVRAVGAALELLEEVTGGRMDLPRPPLEARAVIHGGPAMIRGAGPGSEGLHDAEVSLGPILDVANALLLGTTPGTVLVSGSSSQGLAERFELETLPSARLKGLLKRPLPVARPVAVRDRDRERQRRFDAVLRPDAEDSRPWVGRRAELELIADRGHRSASGSGQVVALCAEAGMGRGRLLLEAVRRFGRVLEPWVAGNVSDLRRHPGGLARRFLGRWRERLIGAAPGAADEPKWGADGRVPAQLTEALLAHGRQHPLALIFEDLQWADAESLAWIAELVDRCAESAILLLLSYRPGLAVPWGEPTHLTRLALPPLTEREASELVSLMTPSYGVIERRRLVVLAAGRPRDLIELVSTNGEPGRRARRGTGGLVGASHRLALPWRVEAEPAMPPPGEDRPVVPPSLEASLVESLACLGSEARNLVRLASVLEPEGPARYLAALSPLDPEEHDHQVTGLIRQGILGFTRSGDDPHLVFRRPLLRQVAYESLIRRDRRRLHRRLAELLEEEGAPAARRAPQLARAGEGSAAVEAYREAALEARRDGDRGLAVAQLEAGLEELRQLEDGGERDRRELSLLTALGPLLSRLRGFDHPTLEETYGRAAELCLRQEDDREQFPVLRGIAAFFITRARPRRNLPLLEKLERIAQQAGDDRLLCESAYASGLTHFSLGELAMARRHFEAGIAAVGETFDPVEPFPETGEDPAVGCLAMAALVSFLEGDGETAVELSSEAIDRARALDHSSTLVAALALGAWLHQLRRDGSAVRQRAREALGIARAEGLLVWATHAELLLGWARAVEGSEPSADHPEGRTPSFDADRFEKMTLALEIYRDHGVLFAQTYLLSLLAEIAAGQGQLDLALRHLLEALTAVEITGEAFWQAELLRACGALALGSGGGAVAAADSEELTKRQNEAESYFERSLQLARRQGAAALEQRAARDLARLWRTRGREDDARRLID